MCIVQFSFVRAREHGESNIMFMTGSRKERKQGQRNECERPDEGKTERDRLNQNQVFMKML